MNIRTQTEELERNTLTKFNISKDTRGGNQKRKSAP